MNDHYSSAGTSGPWASAGLSFSSTCWAGSRSWTTSFSASGFPSSSAGLYSKVEGTSVTMTCYLDSTSYDASFASSLSPVDFLELADLTSTDEPSFSRILLDLTWTSEEAGQGSSELVILSKLRLFEPYADWILTSSLPWSSFDSKDSVLFASLDSSTTLLALSSSAASFTSSSALASS